ncbi:MAG: class I SAM-dependent methyltransferase [Actinomycetota bacterium]
MSELEEPIRRYYDAGAEQGRLRESPLERDRTRRLLHRFLPAPPARIADVGGGPGGHALWLAERGYDVALLDAMSLHVDQAIAAGVKEAVVGDARSLPWEDAGFDAVLLFGPLYHLTEGDDRLRAMSEAARVVRPGGVVMAAAISRFASFVDGLVHRRFADPAFREVVDQDIQDGQHRNAGGMPGWFTTAFFHTGDELATEVGQSGLILRALLAVEGPGSALADDTLLEADPAAWSGLLDMIQRVEAEPSLLGLSSHIMAVAHRPRRSA